MAYIEIKDNVIIQFENTDEYYLFKKTPTYALLNMKGFFWNKPTCTLKSNYVTESVLNIIFESDFFELSKIAVMNDDFLEYQNLFNLLFDFSVEKVRNSFFGNKLNISDNFLEETGTIIKNNCSFLFDYQLEGVRRMLSNLRIGHNFLCGDEMGTGKTVMSIALAKTCLNEKLFDKIIVLTNVSIVNQFNDEFLKFTPEIKTTVIKGKAGIVSFFKKAAMKNPNVCYKGSFEEFLNLNDSNVFITNHELFSSLKEINDLKASGKILLIVDEASKLKNCSSKLSKAFKSFMKTNNANIVLFTGTPFENNLEEFFNLIKLVAKEEVSDRLFEKNFVIKVPIQKFMKTVIVNYRNHYAFNQIIQEYFIRRKLIDVKDNLPQKNEHIHVLETDNLQFECMKKFGQLFDSYIESRHYKNMEPKDLQKMTTTISRMIASDPYILKESESKIINFGKENNIDILSDIPENYYSPKVIEIINIVKEIGYIDKKSIIFTFWSTAMKRIENVLHENFNDIQTFCIDGSLSAKKRSQIINDFKESKGGVLIATDAISYGIDFPDIDFLVEFDIPWNPAKREQRLRRIYRAVSKTNKTTIDLTTDIENYIIGVVSKKTKNFLRSVDGQENLNSSMKDKIISKGNTTEICKIFKNIIDKTKQIQIVQGMS